MPENRSAPQPPRWRQIYDGIEHPPSSPVPAAAASPLTGVLTGSAGLEEYRAPCGHIGLFVGRSAHRRHIPALADWFEKHSEKL